MAILRGGRRIGNYDIRLGIPRDRSLDNVEGDTRLGRVQGGNPESTIGRVMGQIAQGEGFAKPNRYMVDFILPKVLVQKVLLMMMVVKTLSLKKKYKEVQKAGELQAQTEIQRGLRAFVDSVDMVETLIQQILLFTVQEDRL